MNVGAREGGRQARGVGLAEAVVVMVMVVTAGVGWGASAAEPARFVEDFTRAELGKPPASLMILEGQFRVKEEGGNRFLELPGAPLDSFAAIFGSAGKEGWGAQARCWGTLQGRRYPVFGVSINGVGGYRLQVAPAKREVELLKGDETVARAPFVWQNGSWTQVRIQIRKTGEGEHRIEGKAWVDGTMEPKEWTITWVEKEELVAGRAAVWGKPFSGTPIRFDDFKVLPVEVP